MKKLWQKNWNLNKTIEDFETRGDVVLDQQLVKYDVWGSLAQAQGLVKIGILSPEEKEKLKSGLIKILDLEHKQNFKIQAGDEDVHTKIENFLVENYGDVGKKIHTGRSRNDQVLTAIRLFSKDKLLEAWSITLEFIASLLKFSQEHEHSLMPGYTHMQKAMPSSAGMWSSAIAEGLLDSLIQLKAAYEINDQSPLGSAAGYGVPLPLEREYMAKLLGFKKVQTNSVYCQNSRGKIEAIILASLVSLLSDLNKFATDVLLFTTSEFNFFEVAKELCSGSSIMPQKKNVDVAELLRSKVHVVLANYVQTLSLSSNLISGYNRDLQDTKKPLFESLDLTIESLKVANILINNISIKTEVMKKALTPEIFATHRALNLVKEGMPFRDAYMQAAKNLNEGLIMEDDKLALLSTHTGGIGNLAIKDLKDQLNGSKKDLIMEQKFYEESINKLIVY